MTHGVWLEKFVLRRLATTGIELCRDTWISGKFLGYAVCVPWKGIFPLQKHEAKIVRKWVFGREERVMAGILVSATRGPYLTNAGVFNIGKGFFYLGDVGIVPGDDFLVLGILISAVWVVISIFDDWLYCD